ncbi:meckelin isoform X2 [Teleopsis dalmanni]|uniref:meckelin isoform X2 n=1 Tax=Teleopsis dalmanni TaxID=139649 RepID=UPI0018CDD5D9|nr:meckelin isoform X2 [Teleopsis dalmanni]
MIFRYVKLFFLLFFGIKCAKSLTLQLKNFTTNSSLFHYTPIRQCGQNEYYDLNFFKCIACNSENKYLQPTANKFSCECLSDKKISVVYDSIQNGPICDEGCVINANETNKCQPTNTSSCNFLYINSTRTAKHIQITTKNPYNESDCNTCDLKYNFNFETYCIVNALLKPYLNYNSFWVPIAFTGGHYGELKFIAFFCFALHNNTACNRLANYCVMSHYSLDNMSPCNAFLVTQTSDIIRYTSMGEPLQVITPFLFFEKGKNTVSMLNKPIDGAAFTVENSKLHNSKLNLFSTHYNLDGSFLRWGSFNFDHINLCGLHSKNIFAVANHRIHFAKRYKPISCELTLENIIDLSQILANNNFLNIFFNYTKKNNDNQVYLQPVPILIETLTAENQRMNTEEWRLVKRFLLIVAISRNLHGRQREAIYEDTHKLQLYSYIRYVDSFQLFYKIHDENTISIPIIKLRYRSIELNDNSSLSDLYSFKIDIKFEKMDEMLKSDQHLSITVTILLFITIGISILHTYNSKKRRSLMDALQIRDICDFSCITEFFLHFFSNTSNAILLGTFLLAVINSLTYLFQETIKLTLPLNKVQHTFDVLIFTALLLKAIYLGVYFWRVAHIDLFFIDWERPKCCDNNHISTKTNLETSSVCSSVRTFISENNVSAWRTIFTANEWVRLSTATKTSMIVQGFAVIVLYQIFNKTNITQDDITIKLFLIYICYISIFITQIICYELLIKRLFGNPLLKFTDLCSLANISLFILLDTAYGFYIHGRSPHGFADTDMSSIIMQLQRESQNMCGRRGLLTDSDQQTYIIVPPISLRSYFKKLMIPFQRSWSISQAHFQKEVNTIESNLHRRSSLAYSSVNRFFCAFIDHIWTTLSRRKALWRKYLNAN